MATTEEQADGRSEPNPPSTSTTSPLPRVPSTVKSASCPVSAAADPQPHPEGRLRADGDGPGAKGRRRSRERTKKRNEKRDDFGVLGAV